MRNSFLLGVASLLVGACRPGVVPEAAASKPPTYAEAVEGKAVAVVDGSAAPLVVDWDPEQRTDLEVMMQSGIAVVAYDGGTLRLLKQCAVDGFYGFKAVTRKERVIQIRTADELRANLPLGGFASFATDIQRGQVVDIGLVIVGKQLAVRPAVQRDALKGSCAGATHFVHAATIGAFAMRVGSGAEVRAAAEVFSAGANAGSSSNKNVQTRDGDLASCATSRPSDTEVPDQCGALLRVELAPIGASSETVVDAAIAERCPDGLQWINDKCTKGTGARLCRPGDEQDCRTQCEAGSAESCDLFVRVFTARPSAVQERLDTQPLLHKGCAIGAAAACFLAGLTIEFPPVGVRTEDPEPFYQRACDGGDPRGCNNLAIIYEKGYVKPKDEALARKFVSIGCRAGYPMSCRNLGRYHRNGVGGPVDPAAADAAYRHAAAIAQSGCDAGVAEACYSLSLILRLGNEGLPKDEQRSAEMERRACERGYRVACQ